MTKRNVFQDALSIIILLLGLFTLFSGFLGDFISDIFLPFDCIQALFGSFVLASFLVTLALNLFRLLRISFSSRKRERIIAAIYILLFVISSYSLCVFVIFGLFNNHIDTPEWLIVRNWISILFLVFCIIWLVIRCISILFNGRSAIVKEEFPR